MTRELELRIQEIIPRTYNVKSVRLAIEEEPDFKAGQFLCVTLKTEKECRRYLSISSSPTEKGYIEFTKKITESDFSQALNNFKPGDTLYIKYPMGNFTLDKSGLKVAFLSGGIGITPIRSICKFAADKKLDIDIVLIYANRAIVDIVFKEDFDVMQKQNPRLKVVNIIGEPEAEWPGRRGRISAQVIREEIPDYMARKFYLCGPPAMVEAMERILTGELSVSKECVVKENFQGY
jgi:ferredoxin-NADP reductase